MKYLKKKKKKRQKYCQNKVWSSFTISLPLLLLVALSRELILERPRKESEGSVAVKETKISEEKINSFHDSKLT